MRKIYKLFIVSSIIFAWLRFESYMTFSVNESEFYSFRLEESVSQSSERGNNYKTSKERIITEIKGVKIERDSLTLEGLVKVGKNSTPISLQGKMEKSIVNQMHLVGNLEDSNFNFNIDYFKLIPFEVVLNDSNFDYFNHNKISKRIENLSKSNVEKKSNLYILQIILSNSDNGFILIEGITHLDGTFDRSYLSVNDDVSKHFWHMITSQPVESVVEIDNLIQQTRSLSTLQREERYRKHTATFNDFLGNTFTHEMELKFSVSLTTSFEYTSEIRIVSKRILRNGIVQTNSHSGFAVSEFKDTKMKTRMYGTHSASYTFFQSKHTSNAVAEGTLRFNANGLLASIIPSYNILYTAIIYSVTNSTTPYTSFPIELTRGIIALESDITFRNSHLDAPNQYYNYSILVQRHKIPVNNYIWFNTVFNYTTLISVPALPYYHEERDWVYNLHTPMWTWPFSNN